MLEHRELFDLPLEDHDRTFGEETGLQVKFSGTGFLLLQSPSESALRDALASEIGLRLPESRGAHVRGDYALLWLSPTEWLLELPASETDSLESTLGSRLARSHAVATDMSNALVCFEVSGTRAPEVLMSGCSVDIRGHAFPAGSAVRTILADIPAIIWNPGEEPQRRRCIVDRSFGRHLRDWLLDATAVPP